MSDNPNLKHKYGKIDKDYAISLATRPEAEDGPIYMVNLMKYHEVAQYSDDASPGSKPISGREADDRYNPSSILSRIGAAIIFAGDVVGNADGPEDWDRIAVVRYPTRKSFIEMQSRKDFGEKHVHKAAGMKRTVIVCCRPEDLSLDTRERPTPGDGEFLTMIVRRNTERQTAFNAISNAALAIPVLPGFFACVFFKASKIISLVSLKMPSSLNVFKSLLIKYAKTRAIPQFEMKSGIIEIELSALSAIGPKKICGSANGTFAPQEITSNPEAIILSI